VHLTAIHRYPVKSCRGESVRSAVVEPWGLAGDRRWMLVDAGGAAITAREVNRMLLVHPVLTGLTGPAQAPEAYGGALHVTAPGLEPLDVPVPVADLVPVGLWGSRLTATPAGEDAHAWFSRALGREARLVYLDDPTRRATSPDFSDPADRVSFADGFPLLVTTQESLAALNDDVLALSEGAQGPVPMTRFRPNVVVSGVSAWAEDDWRRIRIGPVTFRAVKGCARCVITTIDPDTVERSRQPLASLARIRRWDSATWFGVNLVPEIAHGTAASAAITVGDPVEILDRVAAGDGPMRASLLSPRPA